MGEQKISTQFKLHEDTVLNMVIPDVTSGEVPELKKFLETKIFKNNRILFQFYHAEKKAYIIDVKIMRTTISGGKK